ncbi:aflatoxin B1 aldehyde reductase-like protein [Zopfia rhizophila CBS 207.26]|uniref:Aflatoxin B1 aldehyde reductase-like protein n=1 Tax=Zopfia rhizophila CBS 207.26 TaxID=1314779 RepID=A0A6A6E387_9PEZI|nr:aflatoxin B1 aldehyde reductase-like protein [Zopfia rhizophila CBS 207.26]
MYRPRLSFGCANVGISWTTDQELEALAEVLGKSGIDHLDTAARYPPTAPGLAEELLGKGDFFNKGFKIDTKIFLKAWDAGGSMAEEAVDASVAKSLKSLRATKVDTLYCHGPDRVTPISTQAATIHKYFQNGTFEHFGVSNLDATMLEEWLNVADQNGYVKPSIYQGQYNLLCRGWEHKIFPLLRRHGMRFSAFSPLAGGFLTGKLTFATNPPESLKGTRFDMAEENLMGKAFRRWYDKESMHSAMQYLRTSCDKVGVSMMDASLRWIAFHSFLREGDEIVFGATSPEQIETIAKAVSDGPLPQSLVDDIDRLWEACKTDGEMILEY